MKVTITYLVCDRHPGPARKRPKAVISRALTNGKPRPSDPTLDLCRQCDRAIVHFFRPRRVEGRPPAGTRKPAVRTVHANAPMWKERQAKLLAHLRGKVPLDGAKIAKQLRWNVRATNTTLRLLVREKKLVKHGNGRYTTWELVK